MVIIFNKQMWMAKTLIPSYHVAGSLFDNTSESLAMQRMGDLNVCTGCELSKYEHNTHL